MQRTNSMRYQLKRVVDITSLQAQLIGHSALGASIGSDAEKNKRKLILSWSSTFHGLWMGYQRPSDFAPPLLRRPQKPSFAH